MNITEKHEKRLDCIIDVCKNNALYGEDKPGCLPHITYESELHGIETSL